MAADDKQALAVVSVDGKGAENDELYVRNLMDDVERRVEKMREQAITMEQEKEALLATLQKIQDNDLNLELSNDEQEELEANAERLICRCLTIEISVTTPRNDIQETALQRIKDILNSLNEDMSSGKKKSVDQAKSYLNACSSENEGNIVDHRFQGIILDCTADDQKAIRKKLKEMINNFNSFPEET